MPNRNQPVGPGIRLTVGRFSRVIDLTKIFIGIFALALIDSGKTFAAVAPSYSVTLAWDPSPTPDIAGYRVYYGVASGEYSYSIDVQTTSAKISGLLGGVTYFFAVTSHNSDKLESGYSDEISYMPGGSATEPTTISMAGQSKLRIQGRSGQSCTVEATENLSTWTAIATVVLDTTGELEFSDANAVNLPKRFYRIRTAQP